MQLFIVDFAHIFGLQPELMARLLGLLGAAVAVAAAALLAYWLFIHGRDQNTLRLAPTMANEVLDPDLDAIYQQSYWLELDGPGIADATIDETWSSNYAAPEQPARRALARALRRLCLRVQAARMSTRLRGGSRDFSTQVAMMTQIIEQALPFADELNRSAGESDVFAQTAERPTIATIKKMTRRVEQTRRVIGDEPGLTSLLEQPRQDPRD